MTQDSDSPTEDVLSFGDALKRLEACVAQLEQEGTDLDAALKVYEEGTEVARACLERLRKAELRIEELRLQ
jgi:exodeoxyribonuclease VII small subunit